MAFTTRIPLRSRESFFRDPYFSDCWEILDRHRNEFEQKSGLRSNKFSGTDRRDDLDDFQLTPLCRRQYFPTATTSHTMSDLEESKRFGGSGLGIHSDRDNFKVSLDVQQFRPEELVVKTCDNSTIVIEGKHEEKKDSHGFISRNFTRKYTLPADIKVEEVQCNFTADGVLQITAPRHQPQLTNGTSGTSSTSSTKEQISENVSGSNRRETSSSSNNGVSSLSAMSQKIEEHRKRAEEQFKKSTEDILDRESRRDREDFGHSKLLRMFDPHFQAFPEFDPVPFWRRGKTSSLLEDFGRSKKGTSLLNEFSSSKKTSSLLDDLNLNSSSLLSNSSSNAELQSDSDNFKVMLDVQQFTPEELTVKTFDYFVVIEGKHEAKSDPHGFITRQFKRKYMLPRDVKSGDVQCNLSSDGILLVTAPRQKQNELESGERANLVPIHQQKQTVEKVSLHQQEKARAEQTQANQSYSSSTSKATEREHVIPIDNLHRESTYESSSTKQHNISSASNAVGKGQQEHVIPIDKQEKAATASSSNGFLQKVSVQHEDRPHVSIANGREHVIPIDQEHQNGVHVEFPESRPESSASTIPFDFSRQGSEAPVSVASSVAPPTAPVLGKGERIINISIGA